MSEQPHIVCGHVKWFDHRKGYGFVRANNGGKDIMLHVSALRRAGFELAYDGARIVVEVVTVKQGLQAAAVIEIDDRPPPPKHERKVDGPVSDWERATVRWFNRGKGFGFLTRGDSMPDIFVHAEIVHACGFAELRPGQAVMARFGEGDKGLIATALRPCSEG